MRTLFAAMLLVAVLPPSVALSHPDDPAQDPETIETSDNASLVDHHWYPEGSDMYFQRREGRQHFDGEIVDTSKDLLFAGGDGSSSNVDGRMHIFDVTDPTSPVHLVDIPCQGYHADVAVYENLMLQAIDSASGKGCTETERFDPNGLDQPEEPGIRIFDITDPANPEIVHFIDREQLGGWGVHNFTVVPWEGLLYLGSSDLLPEGNQFRFGYVDLTDPKFPVTLMSMNDINPGATAGCHDIGLDAERKLAFCAAVEQTFIWDISDARQPKPVSQIPVVNPLITIHHGARLAPDGTTLVLNDELAGAATETGCFGPGQNVIGALWFYDISDPANPQPQGAFSTDEVSINTLCTSHFYNFIPGTELLVVGWYEAGLLVVDYANRLNPVEHAFLRPEGGASFWSGYYWHGYIYGNSRTLEETGFGGGLWVAQVDGVGDAAPSPHDAGTVWSPWTSQLDQEEERTPEPEDSEPPAPPTDTEPPPPAEPPPPDILPATGGGLGLAVLALLAGAMMLRRRRR